MASSSANLTTEKSNTAETSTMSGFSSGPAIVLYIAAVTFILHLLTRQRGGKIEDVIDHDRARAQTGPARAKAEAGARSNKAVAMKQVNSHRNSAS